MRRRPDCGFDWRGRRRRLAGGVADRRHQCRPRRFVFRGPQDGTRWHCPRCGRQWVWAATFPRSLSGDWLGRSSWWNVEYELAFTRYLWERGSPDPDARDFGGWYCGILPLFGSPGDGRDLHWWESSPFEADASAVLPPPVQP